MITRDRDHEDHSNGSASGIWRINTNYTAGANWFRALSPNVSFCTSNRFRQLAYSIHPSNLSLPPVPPLKLVRDMQALRRTTITGSPRKTSAAMRATRI